jgi:hypothetical protein
LQSLRFDTLNIALSYGIRSIASGIFIIDNFGHEIITSELGAQNLEIRNDSSVIIGQVSGEYEAKDERIQKYLAKVRELTAKLKQLVIKKVLRT